MTVVPISEAELRKKYPFLTDFMIVSCKSKLQKILGSGLGKLVNWAS
jgi:hypothetical protein